MSPIEELKRAIRDQGPNPGLHEEVMDRHRMEWPTLWAAIDKLVAEDRHHPVDTLTDHVDSSPHGYLFGDPPMRVRLTISTDIVGPDGLHALATSVQDAVLSRKR